MFERKVCLENIQGYFQVIEEPKMEVCGTLWLEMKVGGRKEGTRGE